MKQTVGGRLFTSIEIEDGEQAVRGCLGSYSRNRWTMSHGLITLTDRRVVFTAYRSAMRWRRISLPYASLAGLARERRLNFTNWNVSLALPAFVLRQRSREVHYLWASEDLYSLLAAKIGPQADDVNRPVTTPGETHST